MKQQERINYENLYKWFRYQGEQPFTCFYCGSLADTADHCPPISRVDDYRAYRFSHEEYLKVMCCRECNSLLGDSLQTSLIEREIELKFRLEHKFARYIDMPPWTEQELKKMGRNMRSKIEASIRMKELALARVEHSAGINAYIDSLEIIDVYSVILNEQAA